MPFTVKVKLVTLPYWSNFNLLPLTAAPVTVTFEGNLSDNSLFALAEPKLKPTPVSLTW